MTVRQPRYSKEEFAQRGDEIYQSQVRQQIDEEIDRRKYQRAENVISEAFKLLEARVHKIEELRQKIAVGTQ